MFWVPKFLAWDPPISSPSDPHRLAEEIAEHTKDLESASAEKEAEPPLTSGTGPPLVVRLSRLGFDPFRMKKDQLQIRERPWY